MLVSLAFFEIKTGISNHLKARRPSTSAYCRPRTQIMMWALNKWSEWQDLNLRPLVPQTSALPSCATPRLKQTTSFLSHSRQDKNDSFI